MSRFAVLTVAVALHLGLVATHAASAQSETAPPLESGAGADLSGDGAALFARDRRSNDLGSRNANRDVARTGTASECRAEDVPAHFERERVLADNQQVSMRARFYNWVCPGSTEVRWYVPGASEPTSEVALTDVIDEAFERVEPPVPDVVTSPPLGSEVVTGLPMYLAVDDGAFDVFTGEVSAGQFTVTAEVRPVRSRFSPGDGSEALACDGRGSVWSHGERPGPEDCTHTFVHVPAAASTGGSYQLTSQVVYEASYTVEGPILAGEYDLGEFEGPEASVDVPVIERRAVRTVGDS